MSMLAKPGVVVVCSFCFYTPLKVAVHERTLACQRCSPAV